MNSSFQSIPYLTHKPDLHLVDFYVKVWMGLFICILVIYKNITFEQTGSKSNKDVKFKDLPGFRPLPIIGNILMLLTPIKGSLNFVLVESKKLGDCFRFKVLNEKIVVLNSPKLVQSFLKSGIFGHVKKSPFFYDHLQPLIVNGVLVSKGTLWKSERKILSRTMFMSNLRGFFPTLVKHCCRFVTKLEKLSDQQPHLNNLVNISFLEIITELLTGADGYGTETGHEFLQNFETWKRLLPYRVFHPWLLINTLWKFHPLRQKQLNAVHGMYLFSQQRLMECKAQRENKSNNKQFRTMLDTMLDAGISDEQIIDELNTMMFAGHDTTAGTIQFFLLMMALNPQHQELCRTEVNKIFDSANGTLNYEQLCELKYLERCIFETLRMFPVAIIFFRKLETPFETKYNNKNLHLEPEINVAISPWLLHRNPEYFPSPNVFDPDRFLPEECTKRHSHAFIPFSAGPRNCLGMKFALMQLKTVAAHVLHKFEVTTPEKMEDIVLLPNITLVPERDFRFVFKTHRQCSV